MHDAVRKLESRYSLNSYPYADSEYSQQRLRALGIATDQLMEPQPESAPSAMPAEKAEGSKKHLPLLLLALVAFLWFQTK